MASLLVYHCRGMGLHELYWAPVLAHLLGGGNTSFVDLTRLPRVADPLANLDTWLPAHPPHKLLVVDQKDAKKCHTRGTGKLYFDALESLRQKAPRVLAPFKDEQWVGDVHWPSLAALARAKPGLRALSSRRPLIVELSGEVFWRTTYRDMACVGDIVMYRARTPPRRHCPMGHVLQAVSIPLSYDRLPGGKQDDSIPLQLMQGHRHQRSLGAERKFCALVTRSVFKPLLYDTDALVRQAIAAILSEYRHCDHAFLEGEPACSGHHEQTVRCFRPYKFVIAAENTRLDGYFSEKVPFAALADTIPIYFGPNDVAKYVNTERIVHCNVSDATLMHMRSFHNAERKGGPFLSMLPPKRRRANLRDPFPDLIKWAVDMLRDELTPCVWRVAMLDQNDAAYKAVLKQPMMPESIVAGDELAAGVKHVLDHLLAQNGSPPPSGDSSTAHAGSLGSEAQASRPRWALPRGQGSALHVARVNAAQRRQARWLASNRHNGSARMDPATQWNRVILRAGFNSNDPSGRLPRPAIGAGARRLNHSVTTCSRGVCRPAAATCSPT